VTIWGNFIACLDFLDRLSYKLIWNFWGFWFLKISRIFWNSLLFEIYWKFWFLKFYVTKNKESLCVYWQSAYYFFSLTFFTTVDCLTMCKAFWFLDKKALSKISCAY
jgi:hypothetical protein